MWLDSWGQIAQGPGGGSVQRQAQGPVGTTKAQVKAGMKDKETKGVLRARMRTQSVDRWDSEDSPVGTPCPLRS